MYKCSKCGKGVLVKDFQEPIRICKCVKEDGRTPATIVIEMEVIAKGNSKLNN